MDSKTQQNLEKVNPLSTKMREALGVDTNIAIYLTTHRDPEVKSLFLVSGELDGVRNKHEIHEIKPNDSKLFKSLYVICRKQIASKIAAAMIQKLEDNLK